MSELLFCPWCKKISSKMSENGYCQKCFEAKIIRYIPQTELTDLKAKYEKANDIFLRLKSALLTANFDKELREYFLNKIEELGEKE